MGKFDGILLLSDCDGTLTDNRRQVSRKNREAIRYFRQNGGRFTVATGRYPDYIRSYEREFIPNAPIVASNGALLYDLALDAVVDSVAIEGPVLGRFRQVLGYVFTQLPTVQQISLGGVTGSVGDFIRRGSLVDARDIQPDSLPADSAADILRHLDREKPRLLRAFFTQDAACTRDNMERLKTLYGRDFTIVAGWDRGIECLPARCGKGKMALRLKERLEDVHTMVAVGDYDNDIDLLQTADIGYAVANAPAFVKRHACRVTVSNEESAVARVIEELESGV